MRRVRVWMFIVCLLASGGIALASSATPAASAAGNPVLFGDQTVESTQDSNTAGVAQAWPFSNSTTGTTASISVYVDSANTAAKLIVGLYANNNGSPGSLLSSGSLSNPTSGAWNTIGLDSAPVSSGTTYWVALLGASGTPYFRDRSSASCSSQGSAQTNLTSLPSTWSTGPSWGSCPVSAYVNGYLATTTAPPVNTALPTISGTSQQGNTLTESDGTWTGSLASYAYQWQVCDSSGTNCSNISGATSGSYTLTSGDVGHTMRVVVTASNAGGSTPATSAASAVVASNVSGGGGGTGSCTTTVSSVSGLQSALSAATGGSVICVAAGSYGKVTAANVKPASTVTVQPTPGATVTIAGITLQGDSNLTFQGFQFSGGVQMLEQNSGLAFQNNHTTGTDTGYVLYGYSGSGDTNINISHNKLDHLDFSGSEYLGSGQGVTMVGTVSNITVDDNTFGPDIMDHYTQTGGISHLQEDGNTFIGPSDAPQNSGADIHQNVLQIFGSSDHVDFSNNVIRSAAANSETVLIESGTYSNFTVNNNLFDHEHFAFMACPIATLTFTNNTIVGGDTNGVYLNNGDTPSPGCPVTSTNNTITGNIAVGASVADWSIDQTMGAGSEMSDNVSDDGTAPGSPVQKNWTAKWQDTTDYQPIGLPFQAGYMP